MTDLLQQALELTVLGMSMTFAAIGALVLGMYALTALAQEKKPAPAAEASPSQNNPPEVTTNDQHYLAAVAAVAVAVAQTAQPSKSTALQGATATWDGYVRSQHVAQRARDAQRALRHGA